MIFSSNNFLLFGFFIVGIILSLAHEQWEFEHIGDALNTAANSTENAEMPVYLLKTQGNPNLYSIVKMQSIMEKALGGKVTLDGPLQVHLSGRITRGSELPKLAVLRQDLQFCEIHFSDLGNFLGELDHSRIQLEEFFAVMSPCVHLELNGRLASAKSFFSSDYVLQTPQMAISDLGAMETKEGEFKAEWLADWLLFRIDAASGLGRMAKQLEIKGGKMEIVENLVEMLSARFYRGELERCNFVLKMKGFKLEANEFVEFSSGKPFSLVEIANSIWEMRCGNNVLSEKDNEGENVKVGAIFEMGKFIY